MSDDIFFELYKINIACYYNSKLILKIINDDSTNISPTVIEMIGSYETNSKKIRTFDNEVYDEHHTYVKKILCKLFSEKEEPSSLFKNLRSEVADWTQNKLTSFIETIDNRRKRFGPDHDAKFQIFFGLVAKEVFYDNQLSSSSDS
jgi:hypothetical protein